MSDGMLFFPESSTDVISLAFPVSTNVFFSRKERERKTFLHHFVTSNTFYVNFMIMPKKKKTRRGKNRRRRSKNINELLTFMEIVWNFFVSFFITPSKFNPMFNIIWITFFSDLGGVLDFSKFAWFQKQK